MSESKHKKESGQTNDGLTPKPPEILRELLWLKRYGLKHWKLILVAVIVLFGSFIYKFHPFSSSTSEETNQQTSSDSKTLPQTFNFVDFDDAEVRQAIEESTDLKFSISDNVSYKITFTHTGILRPAFKEGYYLFDGGVPVVRINESECCIISEIKLRSWPHSPGNPKSLLQAEIEKDLKQKLREHRGLVVECIVRCLRNEN